MPSDLSVVCGGRGLAPASPHGEQGSVDRLPLLVGAACRGQNCGSETRCSPLRLSLMTVRVESVYVWQAPLQSRSSPTL